jgi:hypothetical protein
MTRPPISMDEMLRWLDTGEPPALVQAVKRRLDLDDPPAERSTSDWQEEIRKLARLREDGLLTEEEFAAKKAELLKRL